MKIKYSIMSSDSNRIYLDFWPLISKLWKKVFEIEPILYYIDKDHNLDIDETYGKVIKLKPVPDVPIYLQCLWVRYWSFVEYPDDVCVISDIDMLPLSKKYFIDSIENIDESKYVHLNPCIDSYGTLPSCYHVCKGSKFSQILEIDTDFSKSVTSLNNQNIGRDPGFHLAGKTQWFADEKYSSDKILKYMQTHPDDIVFLKRDGGQNGHRIDRLRWTYDVDKLTSGGYYDSHSIRPYNQYKNEINKIADLVFSYCEKW
jgi:hypothetical protein